MRRGAAIATLLAVLAPLHAFGDGTAAGAGDGFVPARPGYAWSFPRDHWPHPGYRTEWWYFTGQVSASGAPDQAFGYQLTFFRVGLVPTPPPLASPWAVANLVMAHAAVSDLGAGRHVFSDVLWREIPYLAGFGAPPKGGGEGQHPLAWARAPAGSDARWTLDLLEGAFRLDVDDPVRGVAYHLTATPERPLVFQGPGGLSRKARREGFASLYYSATRLRTEGTITLAGRTWVVRGTSWMDREIGSSQLSPDQVGWDWFALRLADGRDLMLYLLRRGDGAVDFARGTLVERDGRVAWLADGDFTVRHTATWRSAETGATYPARWILEVPSAGLRLEVAPVFADQENRGVAVNGLFYWEGAVRARDDRGGAVGEGYVELTGYGQGSRPPI
jgi:predicted secreted hydrolase